MKYDSVSRGFHWLTVAIVTVMVPVGLIMTQEIDRSITDPLFVLHKGLGATFLVILVLRIGWRLARPAPPLPKELPVLQRRVARLTHVGLYVLLAVMVTSGYVRVTMGGFPIEWFNAIGIPPLLPVNKPVAEVASEVHEVTKTLLIGLILLHVAAAAYHGWRRRDGVVSRMWPPI